VTERFRVVPAAYVFLLRGTATGGGDEVLLQLRQHTGYMDGHWAAAAAGHVERGETAYDAARREALEEIGVELGELRPINAASLVAAGMLSVLDEPPLALRLLDRFPVLRRIPARLVGRGVRREHIRSPEA